MSFLGMLSKAPIIGNLFPSDEAEAHKKNLAQASAAYNAMRPELSQAYTNALGSTLMANQGYKNFLASKYGLGALPQTVVANPFSPRGQGLGSISQYQRGATAGDVAGSAVAGAGQGAVYGTTLKPGLGTAVGAVAGGLLGGLAGLGKRGSAQINDPGVFAPYQTFPKGRF